MPDAPDRLRAALDKAAATASDEAWAEAEALAAELGKPDDVFAAYRHALGGKLAAEQASRLGQRAVRFHEEWFGGEPDGAIEVLERVLAMEPEAAWAFEKLTLILSVAQRWDALLALFDRTIAALSDGPRRRKLLAEAAGVAKDFVGQVDRAIGYLDDLFRARPTDTQVAASLERLLERQSSWKALAAMWQVRLGVLSGTEARELREKAASLLVDKLADAPAALDEARKLLEGDGSDEVACAVLEKILASREAPGGARREALSLLRAQHEKHGRQGRIAQALQVALDFATADEKVNLLREVSDRLSRLGDTAAAMDRLVELLALLPEDVQVRTRLRHLADVTGRQDVFVRGLLAAAAATSDGQLRVALTLEAAHLQEDLLGRKDDAVTLYQQVARDPAADDGRKVAVLRRIVDALDADRAADRLDALERLATLETGAQARRAALGAAARLAEELGDVDRAAAAWRKRVDRDPDDREALDACVDLFARAKRPEALVEALRRRAEAAVPAAQKRADLVALAGLQATALGDPAAAVQTWRAVGKEFGEGADVVDALHGLLAQAERWKDLAHLLTQALTAEKDRLCALSAVLGDLCRERLNDGKAAVGFYARALAADPASARARAGLEALSADLAHREGAVAALVRAYAETDDWRGLRALVPMRLTTAAVAGDRIAILREAARIEESRGGDAVAALALVGQALALAPQDGQLEAELHRLVAASGAAAAGAQALGEAAVRAGETPAGAALAARLRLAQGALLEQAGDGHAALDACETALRLDPERLAARAAVIRLASAQGLWRTAVEAVVSPPVVAAVVEAELVPFVERAAAEAGALRAIADALAQALSRAALPRSLARDLEGRVADWYARGVADETERASLEEKALLRAVDLDPTHRPTLERLAQVQRGRPSRALVDTLLRLGALAPERLEFLAEAAEVVERAGPPAEAPRRGKKAAAPIIDRPLALSVEQALLDRGVALLRGGGGATGRSAAEAAIARAVNRLVQLLTASRDASGARRAVDHLLDAARLPLPAETTRALRRQAATLALDPVGDQSLARELWRRVVEDEPEDKAALRTLAGLYESAGLTAELLGLRKRELALAAAGEERLTSRLELARVAALVEAQTGRLDALLANLEDHPGHATSVAALSELLRSRARHPELADILTTQARKVEERGESAAAARLWAEVAALAEAPLGDVARAIAAFERVAALEPAAGPLDALARLYEACGEPLAAAGWLEQRLAMSDDADRVPVSLRLARAYLAGGQRHRAIACLERALAEAPASAEVRTLLGKLYREANAWEPLARILVGQCEHTQDRAEIAAAATEAASLYLDKLSQPDPAVAVLERAVARVPDDRDLRSLFAQALRASGAMPRAREVLQQLLEDVGRRRSRDRAAVHHQIALVARAEGDLKLAIEHLEQAASIYLDSMPVQLEVAEVAEASGDLTRAEQAYRALLVLARRSDPSEAAISGGQVLLRLRGLALARGEREVAAECLDSALAAALQNAPEARRVQAALLAAGETEPALVLLEKRRAAAASAVEEAVILCELADVRDRIGRGEEALDLLLAALEKVPENADAHRQTRALSVKLGQGARYVAALLRALEQRRRWDDAPRVADLLLRAGEVLELDLGEPRQALGHYARAEQTGARQVDALVAIARVSAAIEDRAEQARAMVKLRKLAAEAPTPAEQGEILYRIAERELGDPDRREEGLAALAEALERVPDFTRALALVRGANISDAELPRVMSLYERVARASGDEAMMLDFLERRAATPSARLDEVREGVELALALGHVTRAEALLERALALAGARPGGMREAAWAVLDLAQRRRAVGDREGAVRALARGRDAWTSPRVLSMVRDLARECAAQADAAALAAQLFEGLRALYPTDRDVWQPLLRLYANLDDREAMERVVQQTTEKLLDRAERNLVRIAWARFLVDVKLPDDASSVLRDILLDEPGHVDALMLLSDIDEARGEVGDAVALLSEALRQADGRGLVDSAGRATIARRLGDLVKKADPAQAKQVYRSALAAPLTEPGLRRSLQESLLELLSSDEERAERAALLEEILAAESGARAAERARELADLHTTLGDEAAVRRTLELGRSRAPDDQGLFDRLEAYYEARGLNRELGDLLVDEAARHPDVDQATALLRRAARARRERLGDDKGAAEILRRAAALSPADGTVMREFVACLVAMNDWDGAIAAVSTALASPNGAVDGQVMLLKLRAELRTTSGDDAAAVADLEQAFAAAGPAVAPELTDALFRFAARCAEAGDLDAERAANFRLAELFQVRGDATAAQDVLFRWVERHPEDGEALRSLRQRYEADGRWDEVAHICVRLLDVEQGDGKVDAAIALAEACERLGHPADAVPSLEQLLQERPGHPALLERLVTLYRAVGDTRRAASLLIDLADADGDDAARFGRLTEAADVLLRDGDPATAFTALERAVALRPKDRQARRLLADASFAAGLYQEAAEALQALIAESRGAEPAELGSLYYRMARAVAALGDQSGQLDALKRALDVDRKNGEVAAELADVAEQSGDFDLALRALRAVTLHATRGPLTPAVAFYRQARIAQRQGDRPRAIIFTKRALQEDPDLKGARQLLDELG